MAFEEDCEIPAAEGARASLFSTLYIKQGQVTMKTQPERCEPRTVQDIFFSLFPPVFGSTGSRDPPPPLVWSYDYGHA